MLFLIALGITLVVWVFRGLGILTFLPGMVLWVLLLITTGLGVVNLLYTRRR